MLIFQVIFQGQGQHENWTSNNLWNLLITSRINTFIIPWIHQGFFFKFIYLHNWGKCSDLQSSHCLKMHLWTPPHLFIIWSLVGKSGDWMGRGQWNEVSNKNWNVVIPNPFGHSIKTQPPREAILNIKFNTTVKNTVITIKCLSLSPQQHPRICSWDSKISYQRNWTKRMNSGVHTVIHKIFETSSSYHVK